MDWKIDWQTWLLLGSQAAFAVTVYISDLLLKNSLAKEVEGYKKDMERALTEHQIKFSQLHAERAMVIKELYNKALELERKIELYTFSVVTVTSTIDNEQVNPIDLHQESTSIYGLLCDFYRYFEEVKIYLNDKIYSLLKNALNTYSSFFSKVINYLEKQTEKVTTKNSQELGELIKNLDLIRTVREELIKEFRSLLGVN